MEESVSLCVSRKWPSAACPENFCAYRAVPSLVADLLMTLLEAIESVPAFCSFPSRLFSARASANTRGESYDTASPFRGRKSRLRGDCCNTTAPAATDALPNQPAPSFRTPMKPGRRTSLRLSAPKAASNPGSFLPPTAADWPSPRIAEKRARQTFPGARRKRQSPALPHHVAESRCRVPESAAGFPASNEARRRAFLLSCEVQQHVRSPIARWLLRAPLRKWSAGTRHSFPESSPTCALPRHILPLCIPQSTARGTSSSRNKDNRGRRGRAGS